MSVPKKADGIALSKPLTPSEAAEQYDTLVRQIREDETPPEYINPDDALVELDTAPTEDSPLDAKPKDELAEFKRSKQVKDSFGDWETLAAIDEIQSMPALSIGKSEKSYDTQESIEKLFESIDFAENKRTKKRVTFPINSAGKIIRHKGLNVDLVVGKFKELFESSILAIEEKEVLKEGHKQHSNYLAYEHYINKFTLDGKNYYYIRFTVPVENAKPKTIENGYIPRKVHSSRISDISIYQKGTQSKNRNTTTGTKDASLIDDKLVKFLNSVNKKDVSKITDEKGEPLVVFHGTEKAFDKFDDKMSGGSGFHFTKNRNDAQRYASYGESPRIVRAFLSVKNPAPLDAVKKAYDAASGGNPQRAAHLYLKKLGYDGFVRGNDIVVFDAKQIIPIDNAPTAEGMSGGGKIVAPSAGATANSRYGVIPGIGEVSSARWFRPEKFADGSPNRAADADKAWLKLKNILGEPDAPDGSLSGSQIAEVSKQIDTWRKKTPHCNLQRGVCIKYPFTVYRTTRAPAFVSANLRTSSSRAVLVSPGVVIANAPCAAP